MPKLMYPEAEGCTWNVCVGCRHNCLYCYYSFRRIYRRLKRRCLKCYHFIPHFHPERLKRVPKPKKDGFVFACDMGDIAFAKPEWVKAIIETMERYSDRDFLLQSKNPSCFLGFKFPDNVILGTTIETNVEAYTRAISQTPSPEYRAKALASIRHPRKLISIEPVIDFERLLLFDLIMDVRPQIVYIGYDNHRALERLGILEPSKDYVLKLGRKLEAEGIEVRYKTIREAWNADLTRK